MPNELEGTERLSVLEASHSALCVRRRKLHRTIDSLEAAASGSAEVAASLERYKKSERQISRERQMLYREIGELIQTLAVVEEGKTAVAEPSTEALEDYAELLGRGYCIPSWASGRPGLNTEEEAWLEALRNRAAGDEIRITHTWFEDRGGSWRLIATIAPPRHNQSYGVPKPLSNPLWRQRFELDWGQRLANARRRLASRTSSPPGSHQR